MHFPYTFHCNHERWALLLLLLLFSLSFPYEAASGISPLSAFAAAEFANKQFPLLLRGKKRGNSFAGNGQKPEEEKKGPSLDLAPNGQRREKNPKKPVNHYGHLWGKEGAQKWIFLLLAGNYGGGRSKIGLAIGVGKEVFFRGFPPLRLPISNAN